MDWIILILLIINLIFTMGLVGAISELKPQPPKNTLDDGKPAKYIKTPVKQTTTLRKKG